MSRPQTILPVALLAFLLLPTRSHAGDFYDQLQIVVVNMTPDADSSPASVQCVKTVKKALPNTSVIVRKLGETKARALIGVKKGGTHFLSWKPSQFKALLRNHKHDGLKDNPVPDGFEALHADAALLIDCRPEENMLDILVATGVREDLARTVTASFRRLELSDGLLTAIGTRFQAYAWNADWHGDWHSD